MTESVLMQERRGNVLLVRLNRPSALNALSPDLVEALMATIVAAETDPGVRALVLTANGRAFCAGGDLGHIEALRVRGDDAGLLAYLNRVTELLNRIEASPVPVIGAVNGLATGGGLELLLCCDLIVAAESARLGDGHANFGLIPTGGASVRLPRRVGISRAKYMLFTGALVESRELVNDGLINIVVPDEELEVEAMKLAATIAARSPLAIARVKNLVNDGLEQPAAAGIRLEGVVSALHRTSHDFHEGIEAFNQKRQPNFTGQ